MLHCFSVNKNDFTVKTVFMKNSNVSVYLVL